MVARDLEEPSTQHLDDNVALRLPEAILLGVRGNDDAAQATRLRVALGLAQEHLRRVSDAYAAGQWTREPEVTAPFALYLTIRCHGDALSVVNHPDFRYQVAERLGFGRRDVMVRSEAGFRWTVDNRGRSQPENQDLINQTCAAVRHDVAEAVHPTVLDRVVDRVATLRDAICPESQPPPDAGMEQIQDHDLSRGIG